jgi:hypothetical protein
MLHDRQQYGSAWNRVTYQQKRVYKQLRRRRRTRTNIDNIYDNNKQHCSGSKRHRSSTNDSTRDEDDDDYSYYYDDSDEESDGYVDDESTASADSTRCKDGERSPSTVFESPITTPQIQPHTNLSSTATTVPCLMTSTAEVLGSTSEPSTNSIRVRSGRNIKIRSSNDRCQLDNSDDGVEEPMAIDPIESSTKTTADIDSLATSSSLFDGTMGRLQHQLPLQLQSTGSNQRLSDASDDASTGNPASSTPSRSAFTRTINANENKTVRIRIIQSSSSNYDPKKKTKKDKNKFHNVSYPMQLSNELRMFAEYTLATKFHSSFLGHLGGNDAIDEHGMRPLSSAAVSTISVAFSLDGKTMASTHGDHTVKITCCITGRLLQSLDGHPRTPWTVKYHPINSKVVASGCLGFQVRVWNWYKKTCLQMIRLEFAIISLSFHPTGTILAIANGTRLHFWGIDVPDKDDDSNSSNQNQISFTVSSNQQRNADLGSGRYGLVASRQSASTNVNIIQSTSTRTSTVPMLIELDQKHMLRCVHFPPNGTSLIIGGANPPTVPPDVLSRAFGGPGRGSNPSGGGVNGTGMSFYLRMWKFDISKVFETVAQPSDQVSSSGIVSRSDSSSYGSDFVNSHESQHQQALNQRNIMIARREIISNPISFVPRALLYNDGGFDVSPDGKKLCACAEFWLPDGVNSVSDLLHREQVAFDNEIRRKEEGSELERATEAMRIVGENQQPAEQQSSDIFNTDMSTCSPSPTVDDYFVSSPELHYTAAVSAALANLRGGGTTPTRGNTYYSRFGNNNNAGANGVTNRNLSSSGRSSSFRDGMEHPIILGPPPSTPSVFANANISVNANGGPLQPRTPAASGPSVEQPNASFTPLTPPITVDQRLRNLSPPPPPGSQAVYGRPIGRRRQTVTTMCVEPLPQPSSTTTTSSGTTATTVSLTSSTVNNDGLHPQHSYNSMRSLGFHRGNPHHAPIPPPTSSSATTSSSSITGSVMIRPPHHLSYISTTTIIPTANGGTLAPSTIDGVTGNLTHADAYAFRSGRYVPHVVTISLDTDPLPDGIDPKLGRGSVARGYQPRLGQLLEACPLDVNKASAVTCVKFSPSTDFCLIGYGVREPAADVSMFINANNNNNNNGTNSTNGGNNNTNNTNFHPVTAIYRIRGGMTHVSTMVSADDDVNIARFHPESGNSFVYGTKQGRVRVLSKRPWNFYE